MAFTGRLRNLIKIDKNYKKAIEAAATRLA